MESTINRRNLMRMVVVTGAAATVAVGAGPDAQADLAAGTTAVAGTVESASPDALVLRTATGMVRVKAGPGARLYSGAGGEVDSTSEFVIGDRVGAMGKLTGNGLIARSVGSVFAPFRATVTSVSADGSIAETTAGPILLKAGRLPYTQAAQAKSEPAGVRAGSLIEGQVWVHPTTGENYLLVRG